MKTRELAFLFGTTPIEDLDLKVRTYNRLIRAGIGTLEEVFEALGPEQDVLDQEQIDDVRDGVSRLLPTFIGR